MRPYGLHKQVGCSCCTDQLLCSRLRGRMRKQSKHRVKHKQRVQARRENRKFEMGESND